MSEARDYDLQDGYEDRWDMIRKSLDLTHEDVDAMHDEVLNTIFTLGRIEGEENFDKLAQEVRQQLDKISRMLSSEPMDRDQSEFHRTLEEDHE